MYSDKLTNQFWLKKFTLLDFGEQFFFHKFVNDFLEILICKINVIFTFRMTDFLKIFVSSGSIQNTVWIALLGGNVTIYPP